MLSKNAIQALLCTSCRGNPSVKLGLSHPMATVRRVTADKRVQAPTALRHFGRDCDIFLSCPCAAHMLNISTDIISMLINSRHRFS
ncbi:hypothetical protein RHECNPAF_3500094 [Rhizobium etli CNPAF512]|nr:hypothetical protein RHECNPAF_3500094 [Rhizobium etli CNPAF512]